MGWGEAFREGDRLLGGCGWSCDDLDFNDLVLEGEDVLRRAEEDEEFVVVPGIRAASLPLRVCKSRPCNDVNLPGLILSVDSVAEDCTVTQWSSLLLSLIIEAVEALQTSESLREGKSMPHALAEDSRKLSNTGEL